MALGALSERITVPFMIEDLTASELVRLPDCNVVLKSHVPDGTNRYPFDDGIRRR
jgi:hypothetical protein